MVSERREDGEELEGMEGGETINKIYCIELGAQLHSHAWAKSQAFSKFFLCYIQHCEVVDLGPSFAPAEIHIHYTLFVSYVYLSSDISSMYILFLSSDFSLKILKFFDHS